ncbi:hypothetical protein TSUD_382220 [Trifolium subterraneum]|nr:hypothetical protein TSUD_382220 [Trifolium subterraneum]
MGWHLRQPWQKWPTLARSTLYRSIILTFRSVQSSVTPYIDSQNPRPSYTKELNSQGSRRTRSPFSPATDMHENFNEAQKDFRRPSISPPSFGRTSNVPKATPHSQLAGSRLSSPLLRKGQGHSPLPSFSARESFEGNSGSSENNSEREMLAEAKRLARFKVELNKSEHNNDDVADHTPSVSEKKSMDSAANFTNGHGISDNEGRETSNVIIGLCPDMCPDAFGIHYLGGKLLFKSNVLQPVKL